MLRICLRQTLRKRNTVEEIGLCGQREVSENRVFAATTAYAREKRLNLELTVNIHANTASVSV